MKLYQTLASKIGAMRRCAETGNDLWKEKHEEFIVSLSEEHLPSGSGFDSGTKIELDACHEGRLVFSTSFHHMNEHGGYDGWTDHQIFVTPSFSGFNLRITGRDRNQIKEYIGEVFSHALNTEV